VTTIIIANKIIAHDLPDFIKDKVIKDLTMDNPAFFEAERRGFSTYKTPRTLSDFTILPDNSIRVPRGYKETLLHHLKENEVEFSLDSKKLVFNNTPYNILGLTDTDLRPYQRKYLYKLLLSGRTEGLIVAPPGSGKTIFAIALASVLGQSTLWLTHRNLLINQAKIRFLQNMCNLRPEDVGMIHKGKWNVNPIFTIASLDTMRGSTPQIRKIAKQFGLVILDECLPKGSNILMLDGSIKDIFEIKDGDITTFGEVTNKFSRETDKIIELRGGWGKLAGTPTHQLPIIYKSILTKNKHTNSLCLPTTKDIVLSTLDKVHKGDFLLVKEENCHTEKYIIGTTKSRLLALIACDGHIEKNLRCIQVGIVKDKDWFKNEMVQASLEFQDSNLIFSNCKRGDLIIREYSKKAIKFLNEYIPQGKKHTLYIPSIMEHASREDIKNYLQVVFDTEGGLNKNQITITMSTPEFLVGIQHLLRKFGIVSRIIPIKPKKKSLSRKEYLRLAMSGYDAFLFYYKIGFSMERKQAELLTIIKKANKFVRRVTYNDVVYRCMEVITKKEICEKTTVYDFTTDKHFFIANGVLSSNCHHCPAATFKKIISELHPHYLYGFTATPYRGDGLGQLMFNALGNPIVTIPQQEVVDDGGIIMPTVYYRPIETKEIEGNNIQAILKTLMNNDRRNNIIVSDILSEAVKGKMNVVISNRKEHCETLFKLISIGWERTGIITGDYSEKHCDEQIRKLESREITTLVATGEKFGEGVDIDILENAFITLPFRSEQDVEQIIGRIQRSEKNKKEAKVFDYVDHRIGVVRDQFSTPTKNKDCRLNAYKRLGLQIIPLE